MSDDAKVQIKSTVLESLGSRKAMFMPMVCVSSFMLVGYAALDTEAPEIITDTLELTKMIIQLLQLQLIRQTITRTKKVLISLRQKLTILSIIKVRKKLKLLSKICKHLSLN